MRLIGSIYETLMGKYPHKGVTYWTKNPFIMGFVLALQNGNHPCIYPDPRRTPRLGRAIHISFPTFKLDTALPALHSQEIRTRKLNAHTKTHMPIRTCKN